MLTTSFVTWRRSLCALAISVAAPGCNLHNSASAAEHEETLSPHLENQLEDIRTKAERSVESADDAEELLDGILQTMS